MAAAVAERVLGRFPVSASPDEIGRFRHALPGAAAPDVENGPLPASFPVLWLGRDEVRAALHAALDALTAAQGRLPVHLAQTITADGLLFPGRRYWLALGLTGPDARHIVTLLAEVYDEEEVAQVRLSGEIALVALAERP